MSDYRPVRTEADYDWALAEVDVYFSNPPTRGTAAGNRFEVLLDLIEHYEAKHYPIGLPDPIDAIKLRMEDKGLTRQELLRITGISASRMSEYLSRKRPFTVDAIRELSVALDLPVEVLMQPACEMA